MGILLNITRKKRAFLRTSLGIMLLLVIYKSVPLRKATGLAAQRQVTTQIEQEMQRTTTLPLSSDLRYPVDAANISCSKLFHGDQEAMSVALRFMETIPKATITTEQYIKMAKNCSNFKKERGYITQEIYKEDVEFPIAFGILVYRDFEQAERLLRLLYRPQNYYCVHVDRKSPKELHRAMAAVAHCFPNIIKSSISHDVVWGRAMFAELQCMIDLQKFKKWKYYINLTGQDFPLKTNHELVKILKALGGGNDIEGSTAR